LLADPQKDIRKTPIGEKNMASGKKSKHRKSSSKREEFSLRDVESLFSKHLLRIVGIVFLGASVWFAANTAGSLFRIMEELRDPAAIMVSPDAGSDALSTQEPTLQDLQQTQPTSPKPRVSSMLLLFFGLTFIGFIGLQLLMRWRKKSEYQIISVFLVFMALLLLIRRYSWNIELVFSLLILMAVGLFLFGRHLNHTGTRLNFAFTWVLLIFWWGIRVMIKADPDAIRMFFIFATLFFLVFHTIQILHGFAGRKKLSRYYELATIALNFLVYYAMMALTLLKLDAQLAIFFITLGMAAVYFITLVILEQMKHPIIRQPFIYIFILLCSLLFPLLFRSNQFILFTGSLSVLLMFYSRQTKNQPSIMVSLILAALMSLWYLKGLVLTYLPAALFGSLAGNTHLFWHGLIAGILVTAVIWTNRWLMKSMKITLSRKWFSRKRYRRALKILFLVSLYVVCFWIWQMLFFCCQPFDKGAFLSWFTYNMLFFIVAIPWLAKQKSSLRTGAIIIGIFSTLAYPTIVDYEIMQLLDKWTHGDRAGQLFPFHYLASILFLFFLPIVLRYGQRSFKGNTLAKRIFLVYTVVMFLIIISSEMIFTMMAFKGLTSSDINEVRDQLLRLPESMVIAGVGLILLTWGFIRGKRFARTLAMILLLVAAGKVIYYDLPQIGLINRVLLLFAFGTILITISVMYNRMRSAARKKHPRRKSRSSGSSNHESRNKPRFHKHIIGNQQTNNQDEMGPKDEETN
jgi:hypothetical protein